LGEEGEKCPPELKKEEKETEISDVPQSKVIRVRPEPPKKKEESQHDHDNIIFYEDELAKSNHSIEFDETKRCLLNSQHEDEDGDSSE
jgi:hypothetical protein